MFFKMPHSALIGPVDLEPPHPPAIPQKKIVGGLKRFIPPYLIGSAASPIYI